MSYQFLFISNANWNSGFDILVKAFSEEFVDEESVSLLLSSKYIDENHNELVEIVKNVSTRPYSPKIIVTNGFYPLCETAVFLFREQIEIDDIKNASSFAKNLIVPDYFNLKSNNIHSVKTNILFDDEINKYWHEVDIIDLRKVLRKIYNDRNLINLKEISLLDEINIFEQNYNKLESKKIKLSNYSDNNKKTISVCILAKNEEKNITDAIQSVKNFADEIIVLDTGSTDNTISICESLQCKIFSFKWNNSFSEARNKLIELSNSDWILMLDSDEKITYETSKIIKFIVSNLDQNFVYSTKIFNFIDTINNINDAVISYMPRLIPNNKNFEYSGDIHETVISKNNITDFILNLENIQIYHYGYQKRVIEEKDKLFRNRSLLEKALEINPKDISNLYHLAINFREEENYIRYLEILKQIEILNIENNLLYIESRILILDALIHLDRLEEAEEYAEKIYESSKNSVNYLFLYSDILYRLGKFKESINIAQEILFNNNQSIRLFSDSAIYSWKLLLLLTNCYYKLEDKKNARIFCKKTIKEAPLNVKTSKLFLDLYSKIILN